MPTKREEEEKKFAQALAKLQRNQMARLIEYMGDPPRVENVPQSYWDEIGKELAQTIAPFLERSYLTSASTLMAELPVGVDWTLVNERAMTWAGKYAFDLVNKKKGGIVASTREGLQTAISEYFRQGWTRQELIDHLEPFFGPVRAEMIAVTEITRAASASDTVIAEELAKSGIEMVEIWETLNDELVCPICGPRDGKERGDGWEEPPPAHPRCRCRRRLELPRP